MSLPLKKKFSALEKPVDVLKHEAEERDKMYEAILKKQKEVDDIFLKIQRQIKEKDLTEEILIVFFSFFHPFSF